MNTPRNFVNWLKFIDFLFWSRAGCFVASVVPPAFGKSGLGWLAAAAQNGISGH